MSALDEGGELMELMRTFLAFESEARTFDSDVCGPAWDWLRLGIFQRLLTERTLGGEGGEAPPRRPRRYGDYARQVGLGALRSAGEAVRWPMPCDVVVLNHWRRNVIQGKEVNMNCFPVITGLADRYRLLVIDPFEMRTESALDYPVGVAVVSSFHMLDQAKARLVSRRPQLRHFDDLRRTITAKFGTDIDLDGLYAEEWAQRLLSYRRLCALFRKYRPRVVMAAHRDFAAVKAAHTVGIPFIELQHSAISPLNMPYNYPKSVRADQVPTLPDYVFTFGDYWNDTFEMPSAKRGVGYPFFDVMYESVRPNVLRAERAQRERNVIMIGGYLAKPALVQTALELSRLLPQFTIFYKLKFSDYVGWQSRYPEEFRTRPNIRVIDNNDIALYEYLFACAYAVGVNSGALYEALACGATAFVLRTGLYEEVRRLYEYGHAFLVGGADEIARAVQVGARPARPLGRELLFRPRAVANVASEVDALLEASKVRR